MPRLSVYLPQPLYDQAVAAGLSPSKIAKAALLEELDDGASLPVTAMIDRAIIQLIRIRDEITRRSYLAVEAAERYGVDIEEIGRALPPILDVL